MIVLTGRKAVITVSVILGRSISRSPVSFPRTYKQGLTFITGKYNSEYILLLMRKNKCCFIEWAGLKQSCYNRICCVRPFQSS